MVEMNFEKAARASIIEQLLDKIKPIPENAPQEVKDSIDAKRQFLVLRCGWNNMPTAKLQKMLA